MAELSLREWDALLPRARATLLLPRLAMLADRHEIIPRLPERVGTHMAAGLAIARNQERAIRWELRTLEQLLRPLGCPVMLLKGAAYFAADLPMSVGRIASDIDVMVPVEKLGLIEQVLVQAGWDYDEKDEYDWRYYLEWMHELPPLCHRERQTVLDVHHAILPRTSRLKPDPALLWASARRLPGTDFLALSPADTMLHSAAHLFQDGDLHLRLRDLLDLHEMAACFGRTPSFWPDLLFRAGALQLERPLYYALRYCTRLFGTELPSETQVGLEAMAPPLLSRAVMDRVAPPTLVPPAARPTLSRQSAALFLYVRSHWLRMPPMLLAAHLTRKSLRRRREARQAG
jgi:hypothetical protein